MNAEHWRKFIESLEGEKGLPEEMHGVSLRNSSSLADIELICLSNMGKITNQQRTEYWRERAIRAESRQIPDLKERVKELVRDAMDATDRYWHKPRADDDREMEQLRALCEPDKGQEVKP